MNLELSQVQVYQYVLLFARIGSALMLLPGFGEIYIPPRIRLLLAFSLTLVMMGTIQEISPLPLEVPTHFERAVMQEALIGLLIGALARLWLYTIDICATIISMEIGMGNAAVLNPTLGMQSPVIGVFLMSAALALLFITDTHHHFLKAIVHTYESLPLSQPLTQALWGDTAFMFVDALDHVFALAFQLSTPFLIIGFVFHMGVGLLNRLMPQMQVFFVLMPLQILLGMSMLMVTGGAILSYFLEKNIFLGLLKM